MAARPAAPAPTRRSRRPNRARSRRPPHSRPALRAQATSRAPPRAAAPVAVVRRASSGGRLREHGGCEGAPHRNACRTRAQRLHLTCTLRGRGSRTAIRGQGRFAHARTKLPLPAYPLAALRRRLPLPAYPMAAFAPQSSWRAMQLNHAACMSAGTCAATAEAGRAWLSRQEQQEDELRTTGGRAGGRWPISDLGFLASFLGELS